MIPRTTFRYMSSSLTAGIHGNTILRHQTSLKSPLLYVQLKHPPAEINISRSIATKCVPLQASIKVDEQILKTKADMDEFIGQLSTDQKSMLFRELNLNILAHKRLHGESGYEIHHYLSKFGRPSTYVDEFDDTVGRSEGLTKSGTTTEQENSTGSVEILPKNDQTPASSGDIYAVGLKNALPFVGFGFLDNLIMIIAGDYIDLTIGTALGISTMAAAALGNTISDVAGIASAWYVEHFSEKFGIHTPALTPFQANSWQIRYTINAGRAIGVTIGCLLGMIPLFFLPLTGKEKKEEENSKTQK